MSSVIKISILLQAAVLMATSQLAAEVTDVSEGEKLFALRVLPIFAAKCAACHGDEAEKIKGGFDMRSREAMLKGGEFFEKDVLIPGEGEKSFLYILTTRTEEDYEMPPKEADKLTEQETWWIRDWINAGAPWPDDKRVAMIQENYAEGEQVATSRALSDDWQNRRYEPEKLWAYRPLEVEKVPEHVHPVDYFINRKLKQANLAPAPDAKGHELARRMSFGLTGLPPSPDEISRFVEAYADDPQSAVGNYAKKLMASPHYGEHFGLHWLDVTRYADTAGFANDYSRPNAWRFRDYVIRAFNDDKPYNQFVREQIAGDEIDPEDPEKLVATGFLRMGPWEQTSMSVFKLTRQQWLDDVTDSVGQTFLGHALQCAKCHDHKFDPIPTRDYYSMMAVFSSTQFAERDAPFLEVENRTDFEMSDNWVKAKISAYQNQHKELSDQMERRRKKESGSAKTGDNGLDPGDEASKARMNKNISRHRWELDRTRPIALSVYTGSTITRNNVGGRLALPQDPWAKGELEIDAILSGGDAFSPTDPVKPGPLSAAVSLGEMESDEFPHGKGKRRLALAEWIVDEKNPLTARVMVNRVWSWHFGKGIAANPNNFGGTGGLPTHPLLLDYLTSWFVENGWSVKKLNQLIMTSEAYRRSSRHPSPDQMETLDPNNNLYAAFEPRRLSAEELRDAMLAASGELNPQLGGIPCRPDINMEVAMQPRQIMGGAASVYEPDPLPKQRNRRTIYAEKIRGLRDPFMETFNQPGPEKSCELRETSTVTPQALTLLNSEEVAERALAFADRAIRETASEEEALTLIFSSALGRTPSESELSACLKHWNEATREEQARKPKQKSFPDSIRRTVMAEKTGEPYDFIEFMPAYTGYKPDLQPADTDARTRGLSQVCLVVFNLNEFAYID